MPESDLLAGPEYAPVADRVALFYERFPEGRIITHLAMHNEREIMFRASVYEDARSRWAAATGWASERVGDGDINTVACLENTETSAIGRALANLGFTASDGVGPGFGRTTCVHASAASGASASARRRSSPSSGNRCPRRPA